MQCHFHSHPNHPLPPRRWEAGSIQAEGYIGLHSTLSIQNTETTRVREKTVFARPKDESISGGSLRLATGHHTRTGGRWWQRGYRFELKYGKRGRAYTTDVPHSLIRFVCRPTDVFIALYYRFGDSPTSVINIWALYMYRPNMSAHETSIKLSYIRIMADNL